MTHAPLLAARGLRVDIDGAALLEGASFATRGGSVAVVGDGYALLRAVAGMADVRAGDTAGIANDHLVHPAELDGGRIGSQLGQPDIPAPVDHVDAAILLEEEGVVVERRAERGLLPWSVFDVSRPEDVRPAVVLENVEA